MYSNGSFYNHTIVPSIIVGIQTDHFERKFSRKWAKIDKK